MADVSVKVDAAGLRELCLSSEMRAALGEAGGRIRDAANSHARAHESELRIRGGRFEKDPYDANVKGGRRTAVCFVGCATYVGALNEARNKSLMRQLH